MRVLTFEQLTVNQRVRFFSENPEREPAGTIISVDPVSEWIVIEWDDDEFPRTDLDAARAIRLLEVL